MAEQYGMKIWLQLAVKNAREIQKDIQAKLQNVDIEGIIGKTKAAGGAAKKIEGFAEAAGMGKNIGKLAATAGAVLGVLFVIKKIAQGIWDRMVRSSPILQGILSVMDRAWALFWRPFGDFLGHLLRPLALVLMRLAVKWLAFTRTPGGEETVKALTGAGAGALAGAGIGAALGIGGGPVGVIMGALVGALMGAGIGAIIALIPDAFKGLKKLFVLVKDWVIDISPKVGELAGKFMNWLWDGLKTVWEWTKDFPGWLWDKIKAIWSWSNDLDEWLWTKIKTIWNYTEDFGEWLWEKLQTVWNYKKSFGSWLWEALKTVWEWTKDFGSWIWGKLKGVWNYDFNFGSWLKKKLKSVWNFFGGDDEGNQRGLRFVPETGVYKLHRGEEVVTPSRAGRGSGNIVLSPTFNLIGNSRSTESDTASQVRRAARMLEFEVRRRNLI